MYTHLKPHVVAKTWTHLTQLSLSTKKRKFVSKERSKLDKISPPYKKLGETLLLLFSPYRPAIHLDENSIGMHGRWNTSKLRDPPPHRDPTHNRGIEVTPVAMGGSRKARRLSEKSHTVSRLWIQRELIPRLVCGWRTGCYNIAGNNPAKYCVKADIYTFRAITASPRPDVCSLLNFHAPIFLHGKHTPRRLICRS